MQRYRGRERGNERKFYRHRNTQRETHTHTRTWAAGYTQTHIPHPNEHHYHPTQTYR